MIETFMNLNVVRTIPSEIISGLITGQYSLHGGVIRWAAGTDSAGQIIRHLIPVAQQTVGASLFAPISSVLETVNAYQLHRLSGKVDKLVDTTQQVLSIANTSMVLSGLNLAITSVGFVVLNQKLKSLEGKLNEIQQEVKAINEMLRLEERAKLAAVLRDLQNTINIESLEEKHRDNLLLNAKNVLAPIRWKYKELLENADSIETAMAYEEYFCLTSLAHARCMADLGMLSMAREDLQEANEVWKKQARRIAEELLLGNNPERFLFNDFSQNVPVSVLVGWLDFVYGNEKGFGHIDELRAKTKSWYSKDGFLDKGIFAKDGAKKLKRQKEKVIPALQKLVSRSGVLDGFVAQYALLEKHSVTPVTFERKISSLPSNLAVNGYIILEPKRMN